MAKRRMIMPHLEDKVCVELKSTAIDGVLHNVVPHDDLFPKRPKELTNLFDELAVEYTVP